jgi:hypothetical protein
VNNALPSVVPITLFRVFLFAFEGGFLDQSSELVRIDISLDREKFIRFFDTDFVQDIFIELDLPFC